MATIFKLIIEDDEGKTTVYPLAAAEILIGRKEGNAIRLMERNISRRHARLLRRNGSIYVEDLDSYNGVRINGERIHGRYEVKEGDLVEIGDFHMALQVSEVVGSDQDGKPGVAKGAAVAAASSGRPYSPGSDPGRDRALAAQGTLPDLRLPPELVALGQRVATDLPQDPPRAAELRDTLIDGPAPALASPEIRQRALDGSRGEGPLALPPFPLPAASLLGAGRPGAGFAGSATDTLTPKDRPLAALKGAGPDYTSFRAEALGAKEAKEAEEVAGSTARPPESLTGESPREERSSGSPHSATPKDPQNPSGALADARERAFRQADAEGGSNGRPWRGTEKAIAGGEGLGAERADQKEAGAGRAHSTGMVARTTPFPRLVCVSTEYAGRAFPLDKPEVVIGRVEENDIVIEHRSVSRSHAKIRFDGRIHKVIDLQSANGILVNNEEYAMTDLRAHDVIELGHVRFRFVPADTAFAPTSTELEALRANGYEVEAPAPSAPSADGRRAPGTSDADGRASTVLIAPSAPDGEAGAYDPSMAATVMDTPLSVVGSPEPDMSPAIVPSSGTGGLPHNTAKELPEGDSPFARVAETVSVRGRPVATVPPGSRGPGGAAGPRPPSFDETGEFSGGRGVRGSAPASEGSRITPKTRAGSKGPEVAYTPAPAAWGGRDDALSRTPPPRRPGPSRAPVYAAAAVGTLAVGVVIALRVFTPGEVHRLEEQIRELYEQQELERVVVLCADRNRDLSIEAARLCGRADAMLNPAVLEAGYDGTPPNARGSAAKSPALGRSQAPEDQAAASPASPHAAGVTGAADAAGALVGVAEDVARGSEAPGLAGPAQAREAASLPEPSARRVSPRRGAERPAATARDRATVERAGQMYSEGMRSFLSGEIARAERRFQECVSVAPSFGDCHRGLGAVYRQRGQYGNAVKAFRRYLAVAPGASDANQVLDAIRDLEGR